MKQLVCEMCGGTDLVKDGGVFVCQTCGCKYSIEEARKMMVEGTVEVTGTVRVDKTEEITKKINSYLQMCQNAFEGSDTDSVVEYSDKVLELDQDNYEAWKYRALTAGWNSSLNNMKTAQVITAAKRTLQLAPPEKRAEVATQIYMQGKAQIVQHLRRALKIPGGLATIVDKFNHIHNVMTAWVSLTTEIPYIPEEILMQEIKDCEEIDSGRKFGFTDVSACAKTNNNNKVRYSQMMQEALTKKLEREKAEKESRQAEYWKLHLTEKTDLDKKKADAESVISTLQEEMAQIPELLQKKTIDDRIADLNKQINSLGMFKGKEKKALQSQIELLKADLNPIETVIADKKKVIQSQIDEQAQVIADVESEFSLDR